MTHSYTPGKTVWVSPSGESQLLLIPDEKDTAEALDLTLAATLDKLDMFDQICVHVKKEQ
jgi:hypothetical protein